MLDIAVDMQSFAADLSELIYAHRRDQEVVQSIFDQFSSLFKSIFGDRHWIRYYRYFPAICRFLYFSSTNLVGLQTIGEEYLALVQVSDQRRRTPVQFRKRLLFVLIESFLELFVRHLKLRSLVWANSKSDAVRKFAVTLVGLINLHDLHEAIFFAFNSKYYLLSKRLSGISYIGLRPQANEIPAYIFKFVGSAVLLQYLVTLVICLRKLRKEMKHLDQSNPVLVTDHSEFDKIGEYPPNFRLCNICSRKRPPVCTPCGHVFCWLCVHEYSNAEKMSSGMGRCPNCRSEFPLNRTIPLLN